MTERKLINSQDASTFEKAFSNAARLPTPEDRKAAMEKGFRDVIREDLHRDSAYQPDTQQRDTRRAPGNGHGWAAEVPICAPPGISLIDRLVENSTVVGGVSRSEARRMLEKLMRERPDDPQLVAAREAMEKEQKKAGA